MPNSIHTTLKSHELFSFCAESAQSDSAYFSFENDKGAGFTVRVSDHYSRSCKTLSDFDIRYYFDRWGDLDSAVKIFCGHTGEELAVIEIAELVAYLSKYMEL